MRLQAAARASWACLLWLCAGASAHGEAPLAQAKLVTPEAAEAIDKGLDFLSHRQLEDGSFGASGAGRNVAVCALSGMAFRAAGITPGRGPYGEHLDRCIDFLLDHTSDGGLIAADDGATRGPMYGQGVAALFLCECYGMAENDALRDRLSASIELIVRAQNNEGGWRYTPEPRDADISVTVCQVMALRAARNAGLAVPKETIDRSVAYVKECQNADGGFRYMKVGAPASGFARTAAGVVALYNAGVYEGPEIAHGLAYLAQFPPDKQTPPADAYYFYGHYYAAQAMWHAGGETWQQWYPAIRDQLVARQRADGAWLDSIGPEYGTAMACIVLQTPNNYLPILQR
jgi:prenyltransferase beta subunit